MNVGFDEKNRCAGVGSSKIPTFMPEAFNSAAITSEGTTAELAGGESAAPEDIGTSGMEHRRWWGQT